MVPNVRFERTSPFVLTLLWCTALITTTQSQSCLVRENGGIHFQHGNDHCKAFGYAGCAGLTVYTTDDDCTGPSNTNCYGLSPTDCCKTWIGYITGNTGLPVFLPRDESAMWNCYANPTTSAPTKRPTKQPTNRPTKQPSSSRPTKPPTTQPTAQPSTSSPSSNPTRGPSSAPSTSHPTSSPTIPPSSSSPTMQPTSSNPTTSPTSSTPTTSPTTSSPTFTHPPTNSPTSSQPTGSPSTSSPTRAPTAFPTTSPTSAPTISPTVSPTTTTPTSSPTRFPTTSSPSQTPSVSPTFTPTTSPSISNPTLSPSLSPTSSPTTQPTMSPTSSPTTQPSSAPTTQPSSSPTVVIENASKSSGDDMFPIIIVFVVLIFLVMICVGVLAYRHRRDEKKAPKAPARAPALMNMAYVDVSPDLFNHRGPRVKLSVNGFEVQPITSKPLFHQTMDGSDDGDIAVFDAPEYNEPPVSKRIADDEEEFNGFDVDDGGGGVSTDIDGYYNYEVPTPVPTPAATPPRTPTRSPYSTPPNGRTDTEYLVPTSATVSPLNTLHVPNSSRATPQPNGRAQTKFLMPSATTSLADDELYEEPTPVPTPTRTPPNGEVDYLIPTPQLSPIPTPTRTPPNGEIDYLIPTPQLSRQGSITSNDVDFTYATPTYSSLSQEQQQQLVDLTYDIPSLATNPRATTPNKLNVGVFHTSA
eukprot:m.203253 g.203253  ORF g.203253 m.203253 type:complete len:694 (-) comp32850_c0_seq2:41-2122(-)